MQKTNQQNMLRKTLLFLLLFAIYSSFGQNIKGIVYDDKARIEGVKVLNITQKIVTTTNAQGEFSIDAKVSDTLAFQSVFYKPILSIVKTEYFEGLYVFELQKIINELDEVKLKNKPKEKLFGEKAFNANLKEVISIDKKKESQKYVPAPKYGLDFVRVAKFIGKLIKKNKEQIPNTITYKQYETLFDGNNFFTKKLLTEDLKIPEKYHSLFYEFLEEKQILESELNYNKRLLLLNEFTMHAQEFLIIVEMAEEKAKTKD